MENKYQDERQVVTAPESPTVHRLLESIQVQINEIGNGKSEINRSLHRLYDTNTQKEGNDSCPAYSDDVVGVLNRINDQLSSFREDFYAISNKLNQLV